MAREIRKGDDAFWQEVTKNLEREIKNSGKSYSQIGRELGIAFQSVAAYSSGKAYPSLVTLKKLCAILECDYEDILGKLR